MWISVKAYLPENGIVVQTKIDDERGCRSIRLLERQCNLWFIPGKQLYVYDNPTHWKYIN